PAAPSRHLTISRLFLYRPTPRRDRSQIALARLDGRAVHEVEIVVPRSRVAPEHVRLAVAVVVTHRGDLPVEVGDSSQITLGRLDGDPIHQIEIVLAARAVPPHDVGLAVAVEVAYAFHLPAVVAHRPNEAFGRLDGGAIHEVEVVLPGARVPPQDVGLAVAVEVADACHGPVGIGHGAQIPLARQDLRAVHRIEIVLAGRRIAPQDV